MKYAIFSDIHGNLEALDVVLALCREENVDHYVCLGDVVGYNANPKECLDIVRGLPNLTIVKGNHDEYASNGDNEMEGFNPHAKAAVLWTRAQLTDDDLRYLSELPMRLTIKGANMTIVHATLDGPDAWGYIFDVHNAADNFSYQFTQLCFCGHSHVPLAFSKRPIDRRDPALGVGKRRIGFQDRRYDSAACGTERQISDQCRKRGAAAEPRSQSLLLYLRHGTETADALSSSVRCCPHSAENSGSTSSGASCGAS